MEFALFGYKLKGSRNAVTTHVCEVTRTRSGGIFKKLLCNSDRVSYCAESVPFEHPELLTQEEAPELKVEKIAPDLIAPIFAKYRSNYYPYEGATFNMCHHCHRILGEYDLEALSRPNKVEEPRKTEKLGTQITRNELKIADAGFEGFAAIRLGASPPIDMELDANGRAKSTQDLDSLAVDLDEEFGNFNEETFCATDSTLEDLFEYLAREVYQVDVDREEKILQDLRDGTLVIVKVQTVPINIVMEEKIIRDVIKIKEG